MPLYLGRFAYTPEAIKSIVENPQDRAKVAAEAAESVGAKLIGLWYAFGEFDGVYLIEAPDNASVAALATRVGASGTIAKTETTVRPRWTKLRKRCGRPVPSPFARQASPIAVLART